MKSLQGEFLELSFNTLTANGEQQIQQAQGCFFGCGENKDYSLDVNIYSRGKFYKYEGLSKDRYTVFLNFSIKTEYGSFEEVIEDTILDIPNCPYLY